MNDNRLVSTLETIGLSRIEADVYLAALSQGPTTVQNIAKASELERTNIYRVIQLLEKKGLMSVQLEGLKKRYVAENPEQLEHVASTIREKFGAILPELKEMYTHARGSGRIKYATSKRGLHSFYNELLSEVRPRDFYYVISDLESWHQIDPEYFDSFIQKRVKKNINIRLLVQDGDIAQYNKKFERNFLQEVRILPKNTKLITDTVITPHKVVIVQFAEPLTTFVIENKGIIEAHKQYFDIMWESLAD